MRRALGVARFEARALSRGVVKVTLPEERAEISAGAEEFVEESDEVFRGVP